MSPQCAVSDATAFLPHSPRVPRSTQNTEGILHAGRTDRDARHQGRVAAGVGSGASGSGQRGLAGHYFMAWAVRAVYWRAEDPPRFNLSRGPVAAHTPFVSRFVDARGDSTGGATHHQRPNRHVELSAQRPVRRRHRNPVSRALAAPPSEGHASQSSRLRPEAEGRARRCANRSR